MIVDANLYWIPEELFTDQALQEKLLSVIPAKYDWYAHVEEVPGTKLRSSDPHGCGSSVWQQRGGHGGHSGRAG